MAVHEVPGGPWPYSVMHSPAVTGHEGHFLTVRGVKVHASSASNSSFHTCSLPPVP